MPKQRITKDMVVEAAFRLARQGGMDAVRVKAIAQELGCSVQPIYGYCENMEGLRREVTARAGAFLRDYLHSRIDPDDPFRSTGWPMPASPGKSRTSTGCTFCGKERGFTPLTIFTRPKPIPASPKPSHGSGTSRPRPRRHCTGT